MIAVAECRTGRRRVDRGCGVGGRRGGRGDRGVGHVWTDASRRYSDYGCGLVRSGSSICGPFHDGGPAEAPGPSCAVVESTCCRPARCPRDRPSVDDDLGRIWGGGGPATAFLRSGGPSRVLSCDPARTEAAAVGTSGLPRRAHRDASALPGHDPRRVGPAPPTGKRRSSPPGGSPTASRSTRCSSPAGWSTCCATSEVRQPRARAVTGNGRTRRDRPARRAGRRLPAARPEIATTL